MQISGHSCTPWPGLGTQLMVRQSAGFARQVSHVRRTGARGYLLAADGITLQDLSEKYLGRDGLKCFVVVTWTIRINNLPSCRFVLERVAELS